MEDNKQTTATVDNKEQAKEVVLTQEKLDEIIKNAMGRAGKEHREAAEAAAARVKELETELATVKTSKTETKEVDPTDVKALQAQLEEMRNANKTTLQQFERLKSEKEGLEKTLDSTKNEAINIKKHVAMQEAANAFGFIDLEEVIALTDKHVKFDSSSNKFIVVGDNGATRMNTLYEEMNLKEFYQEFANKRQHLVKSSHRAGTGATASTTDPNLAGSFSVEKVFGKNSDPMLAQKLKKANPNEYARLKTVAISQKLI